MAQTQQKKGPGCLTIILSFLGFIAVSIGGIYLFISQEWRRSDAEVLRSFQPDAAITNIVERSTMTDKGKVAFYRGNPQFENGESFKDHCLDSGELAGGCKLSGPARGPLGLPMQKTRIYLLKIDDPKFASNTILTGAHETLHVVFERMSSEEKKRIKDLIDQEITKRSEDKTVTVRVEAMKRLGKSYHDELHSTFGTDYDDLSPELENHYQQYFADRSKLVELAKKDGINTRTRRLEQIAEEAKAMGSQLTSMSNQLTAYQNAGDEAAFNSLIGQYNGLVAKYNAKAAESRKIYNEIKLYFQYINPDFQLSEEKK